MIDQSDLINSQNVVRNFKNPKLKYSSTRLGKVKENLFNTEIKVAKPLIKELNNEKQETQANLKNRSNINDEPKLINENNNEMKSLIRRAPKGGGSRGGGSRGSKTSNTSHGSSPKDGSSNKVDTSSGSNTKPNNLDNYGNVYPGGVYYPVGPYISPHRSTSLNNVTNTPTTLYIISIILLCYT